MKKILPLLLSLMAVITHAKTIDEYFNSIRNNDAALTAFFSLMPKGGDLHNHFSGSVYAETYIDYVVSQDYIIDTNTLVVTQTMPANTTGCVHFSSLKGQLPAYKQKLMQKWSVKDYNGVSYPSDKQFFETFSGFAVANNSLERLEVGLLELKNRAKKEHVNYIETMFTGIPCNETKGMDTSFNGLLEAAQKTHNETQTMALLEQLYQLLEGRNVSGCAGRFNDTLMDMHRRLHLDDSLFTIRYQNYVSRVVPPLDLFRGLVLSFMSANTCPLIVGVNIVAPEDNETSMRDYWLHMQMFKFCHKKFPKVKYAMHAGELTIGLVKPEDLSWHINEAVRTAGANRIGHGVDLAYEQNSYDLLKYMAEKKVAIEINLYSNEFILKVKNDQHPFSLYKEFNVPIVIATDDAGVLRSNLTQQYVLLASRYKNVSYQDIKQYVFNSIDYSFIKENAVKEKIKLLLKKEFADFEEKVRETHSNEIQ